MHEDTWFSENYSETTTIKGKEINFCGEFQGIVISSHYSLKLSNQIKGLISWLVLITFLDLSIVLNSNPLFEKINPW